MMTHAIKRLPVVDGGKIIPHRQPRRDRQRYRDGRARRDSYTLAYGLEQISSCADASQPSHARVSLKLSAPLHFLNSTKHQENDSEH